MGGAVYGIPIIEPSLVINYSFDYVLIAIYAFEAIREVKQYLTKIGLKSEKVIALAMEPQFIDVFEDQRMRFIKDYAKWAYGKNSSGNVAECGVFRGDSAKFINKYFPDKKLYLFDTFEGFEQSDIEFEIKLGDQAYNTGKFTDKEMFNKTNIELVMRKMLYPQNIQICKGYFPLTAEGIEDIFCFVNLDMDLYLPMLNGLRYFWCRMVEDGCVLLHDYFRADLPGVRKAVEDFEKESNTILKKIPIGDSCSIALIK